ncbi:hypothetical protein AB0K18_29215 [Nonomuraea sp. NPDC049421]|uniref:hypothetical protein n=1 Tax=Nonomuraea sp. NPDC049421 TaxID=3155275 RepID=UPI003439683E
MCHDPLLPPSVAAALTDYRSSRDAHDVRWGEPPLSYVVQAWTTLYLRDDGDFWGTGLRQMAARLPDVPEAEPFGISRPPARHHTGFAGAVDWPPNAVALEELRSLGGLTGYGHPFRFPFTDDDPPDVVLGRARNCSAREIVADPALGLIDTLDVLNHSSISATAAVYRRLIGAATG